MKILENPNPAKSKVHVCEKCQCKFEFTERDVKVDVSSDANGRIGGTHYCSLQSSVACPNCGEPYILESKSGYTNSCIGCMDADDEEVSKVGDMKEQKKITLCSNDETATDAPEAGQGEWQQNKVYKNGDRVNCNGFQYECQGEFKPTDISGKASWKDNAVRTIDRLISWMLYSMAFCFLFRVAGLNLSVREIIAYSLMLGLVVGSINNIERVMRELFRKED